MDGAELERASQEADLAARDARRRLVAAVRRAHASGMSQRQIAKHSARSQAEISRLLRFHGTSPRARKLRAQREQLISLLADHGLTAPRVFGSFARGTETAESDLDLLVTAEKPMGLFAQAMVERDVARLLDLPVDLIFDHAIRPDLETCILEEAVPL